MAGGVNKVILIGNLGADPEIKTTNSGVKVARLRLATSETYTNKSGEKITHTEWHSVNVWRGLAEVAEKYLSKGKQVYIEGKIRSRSYEDKEGNTKYITEIEADQMTLLGGRPSGSDESSQTREPAAEESPSTRPVKEEAEDDLPF